MKVQGKLAHFLWNCPRHGSHAIAGCDDQSGLIRERLAGLTRRRAGPVALSLAIG